METIIVNTQKREEIIDITDKVKDYAKGIKEGFIIVFSKHTSNAICINENDDPKIYGDLLNFMKELVPQGKWEHDKGGKCDRGNGDAHIKSSILGSSEIIPVKEGTLQLGKWQNIWLCEFDGPREREIIIQKWDAKYVEQNQ